MTPARCPFNLIWLLLPAALCLYLIGNEAVGLWDRDEPRYAQTSRQMLQSNDWVVPKLLDEPRLKKPVFIYWCQALSMKMFEDRTSAARLPSSIFVAGTVALLGFTLRRWIGGKRAIWTAFIFATSGLTIAAAKMCITDGVLILFITTSQLCLAGILIGGASWPMTIVMGLSIGFGLLTKGPVAPAIVLLTWITDLLLRRFTADPPILKPDQPKQSHLAATIAKGTVAILLAAIVLAPWIYAIEQRIPNYTLKTIKGEVIDRGTTAQEGHKGPPGFYLLLIWVTYFPWSLLLPAAIVSAWKHRQIPHIRFALAAVLGPWVMLEIYQTKLPHYALPIFPPLAFLTADMLIRAARKREFSDTLFLRIVQIWTAILFIVSLAPFLGLAVFGAPPGVAWFAMILLPILALELGRSTFVHFRAGRPLGAGISMGIGMILIVAVVYRGYLPYANFLRISPQVADVLEAEGATHPGDAIMIDYKETSLAFYQGGSIRPQRLDNFLQVTPPLEWPKWIVLTDTIWSKTPEDVKNHLEIVSKTHGWNYADGSRVMDVLVVRKKPTAATLP